MAIALNLKSYFGALGSPYYTRMRCEPLSAWLYDYAHPEFSLICAEAERASDLDPHYHAMEDLLIGWQNKFADLQSISSHPNRKKLHYHPLALHVPRGGKRVLVGDVDSKKDFLRERYEHYMSLGENYSFLRDLKAFLVRRSIKPEYAARLDGYVLEMVGFEDGLRGKILDPCADLLLTSNGPASSRYLSSVFCLLGLMRSGTAGMRSMAGDSAARVADAFMDGVRHHIPDAPYSLQILAKQWAKVNRFQLQDKEIGHFSKTVGIYTARVLYSQFMLAKAMGFQWTTLKRHMHQLNITEFVYAHGWLQGYLEHVGERRDDEWIGVVEKNTRSVIAGAMVTNDIRYAYLITRDFPAILAHFMRDESDVKVTRMKKQEWRLPYDGAALSQALLQGGALKYIS